MTLAGRERVDSIVLIQPSHLWHGTLTLDRLLERHSGAEILAIVNPVLLDEFRRRPGVRRVLSPRTREEWRAAWRQARAARPDLAVVCYSSACHDEYLKCDLLAATAGASRVWWLAPDSEGPIRVRAIVMKLIRRLVTAAVLAVAFYPLWLTARVGSRRTEEPPPPLAFTGERTNPTRASEGEFHDHVARYRQASRLAAGQTVLDLGCGDGYGSTMLAVRARRVVAIDVSEEAACSASRRHREANLRFVAMDAMRLGFRPGQFDVVCAFEVIEHVEDCERFCAELAAMLRPGGTLVLSTPNKRGFSPGMAVPPNRFHRVEFMLPEFEQLLRRHFARVELYGLHNEGQAAIDRWRYIAGLLARVDRLRLRLRLPEDRRLWVHRRLAWLLRTPAGEDLGPEVYRFDKSDAAAAEGFFAVVRVAEEATPRSRPA